MDTLTDHGLELYTDAAPWIAATGKTLTCQEQEDRELAEGVIRGVPGAEEKLAVRFRDAIYALLLNMTSHPARAEDLTQESLILVIEKLRNADLDHPHRLTSFVFSIARFKCLGSFRRKDNQVELRASFIDIDAQVDSPEEVYLAEETSRELVRLIDTLPVERDREILQRHYLNEQSINEICEAMALTNAHYYRVISRAKTRLMLCAAGR